MGDPAVVRFWTDTNDEHPISLYLHWGAHECAKHVSIALNNTKDRWDDEDYATRMAIQSILEHQEIGPVDLGAGLYVGTAEPDGVTLNVNWGSRVVWTDDQRIPFDRYISGEWTAVA